MSITEAIDTSHLHERLFSQPVLPAACIHIAAPRGGKALARRTSGLRCAVQAG